MPGLQVQRLLEADLPAYKALRDTVLAAETTAFTSDAEPRRSAESYLPRLGNGRCDATFTLGAVDSQLLVGVVTCERDARRKVRHVGHLIGMMVSAEVRRLGIGKALLEACVAEAQADPELDLLTLSVTAENESAVRLYERTGFVRYGRLERAICVDGVYYAKDLMQRSIRQVSGLPGAARCRPRSRG